MMQIAMPLFALATPEEPGAGGMPMSDDGLSTPTAFFLVIMGGAATPAEQSGITALPVTTLPVATKQATVNLLSDQEAAIEIQQGENVLSAPHEAQEQIVAEVLLPGRPVLMQPPPTAQGPEKAIEVKTIGDAEGIPTTPLPFWAGAGGIIPTPTSDSANTPITTTQSPPASQPGAEASRLGGRVGDMTAITTTQSDSRAPQPAPSGVPVQPQMAVPTAAPAVATTPPQQGRPSDLEFAVPTTTPQMMRGTPMAASPHSFDGTQAGQMALTEEVKHANPTPPHPTLPPATSPISQPSGQTAAPEATSQEAIGQKQHLPYQRNSAPAAQPTQIMAPSAAVPTPSQTTSSPTDRSQGGPIQLSRQPEVTPSHTAGDVPMQTMNRQASTTPAMPLLPADTPAGEPLAFTSDPKIAQTDHPELTVSTSSVSPAVDQAQPSQILPSLVPQTWKDTAEVSRDAGDPDLAPLELKGSDLPQARMDPVTVRTDVPRHMAQQIAEVARMMPDRPVELTLSPEELGRLRMTFTVEGNTLSVALSAERPETMDLMRRHIDALAQELREIGYDDVSFDFAQGGGSDSQKSDRAGSEADFTTSDWSDMAADTLPSPPARLDLTGSGGVDIRL